MSTMLVLASVPGTAVATTLFDANTGLSKTDLLGVADFGQQITLNGPNEPYTLTSISFLGTWWTNVSAGSQAMLLDFYTGADLSPGAANALQVARFDNYAGYFLLTPPSANGSKSISFSLPAHTVVPSKTFTLRIWFETLSYQYSTAVSPVVSTGTPVTGSQPGFLWADQNDSGILSGADQISGENIDIAISGSAGPTTYLWNNASGGDWDANTDWNPYGVPTNVVNTAFNLSSAPLTAAGYTVTLTHPADTCQTLTVESDRVTLAVGAANSASGSSGGSLTIAGALTVGQPASASSSATTYGFLALSETGVGSPVNVSAGSVVIGTLGGVGRLTVGDGVHLSSAGGVSLGAGSSLVLQPGGLLTTPSLSLAGTFENWTSSVDISNGSLDLANADLGTVTNEVKEGFNFVGGATWLGTDGITSSTAASDTSHLTAIGVIENNQSGTALFGAGTSNPLFEGGSPGPGDVLVKYTYFGDANLDGVVDGSDYSLIDAGYLSNEPGFEGTVLTGWFNGDFNYDGMIDGSDYALIDNDFNNQGVIQFSPSVAAATTQAIAVLPESVNFVPVAVLGCFAVKRARRRDFSLRAGRCSV